MNTAKKRAYQEKAEAELRAWSARVDELLARARARKAAGKIEYYDRIEKLGERRDAVREQLEELKETSGDAWDELRRGFERAHYELSSAFHTALSHFREDTEVSLPLSSSRNRDDSASAGA